MEDKELLRLAAKAAGIRGSWLELDAEFKLEAPIISDGCKRYLWRPLQDDGDALRLAVSLSLLIRHSTNRMEAYLMGRPSTKASILFSYDPDRKPFDQPDMQSAARLAIVSAAAKIGANQP